MTHLNRRALAIGAAALTTFPAKSDVSPWSTVVSQADALDQCRAIIVLLRGETVVSKVFRGPGLERAAPIKSVSKTIVAALTGIAIDRGEISSPQQTLANTAPRLIPKGVDPRVAKITIEHLLTMQAGLERTSGVNYGGWVQSADWVANALMRPFVAEPGSRMLYSTGSFHVLGAVLSEVSGESLLALARSRLGQPLGIEVPAWTRDPQGRYLGGNEMSLSLPAMARFGDLYRRGGEWDGVQVISKDWVESSLLPRTRSPFSGLDYGYGWFLGRAGNDVYALARGYGGQLICIAPQLGFTLALTSDPTRPARSAGYFGDLKRLIEDVIIPTARGEGV